jgi:hypothetical protein
MFIAAPFKIAKVWKQPRCPTNDECIKKMWYLCTLESYSATKKNGILSFTSKWMDLENIILREFNQAQRPKLACFLSYADYRPKTNAVMLLDIGHTLQG